MTAVRKVASMAPIMEPHNGPMAYVDLSRDAGEMQRIFAALRLAAPGEAVRAQPLAGGVSSGIYRVDLASGSYCLKQALPQLKVAKEWKVPVERVFHEVAYLQRVARIAPGHVPRVLGQDELRHGVPRRRPRELEVRAAGRPRRCAHRAPGR
jgi:hypothetical protein